jgi:hypothetical protein
MKNFGILKKYIFIVDDQVEFICVISSTCHLLQCAPKHDSEWEKNYINELMQQL